MYLLGVYNDLDLACPDSINLLVFEESESIIVGPDQEAGRSAVNVFILKDSQKKS